MAHAENARAVNPAMAEALLVEAAYRESRREALKGQFASAVRHAELANELAPRTTRYQQRLEAVRGAADAVLQAEPRFFPDTVGISSGKWWWQADLLKAIRGAADGQASVEAPLIMRQVVREGLEDVYALGVYQPWHEEGPAPLYTRYIRELKAHGATIELAAVLLRQGLVCETDWIEEIDAIVPMATSLRSYEARGFELTESLADALGLFLALPVVDVFERDALAQATHAAGGYRDRAMTLADELRMKSSGGSVLRDAESVLVIDDVITYGATLEACAIRLREAHPHLAVFGATLAYTQTQHRRDVALDERGQAETD